MFYKRFESLLTRVVLYFCVGWISPSLEAESEFPVGSKGRACCGQFTEQATQPRINIFSRKECLRTGLSNRPLASPIPRVPMRDIQISLLEVTRGRTKVNIVDKNIIYNFRSPILYRRSIRVRCRCRLAFATTSDLKLLLPYEELLPS
ncbi:hypothetical protein BDV19DRAFT_352368 [Aspergillus venezuelensis]